MTLRQQAALAVLGNCIGGALAMSWAGPVLASRISIYKLAVKDAFIIADMFVAESEERPTP
uniref:Uncharacterized protein n=1 Tax=viral metagenome TaxID=1070528 RepID=A0A6M3LFD2_9ZZZZ